MKRIYRKMSVFIQTHKMLSSVGLACVLLLLAGFFLTEYSHSTYIVELQETGFVPDTLEIRMGDTITFVNKRDVEFWPASDIHPTHEIYSEFDPREPLPPGSSWSFTFTKPGKWNFHDHLAPLYVGTVTVLGEDQTTYVASECNKVTDYTKRLQCWDDELKEAYKKGGIKEGFDTFAKLFNSEFEFAQECHGFTHTLGNMAYKDYTAGKDFEVTNQVAYCSYGFFHGFMESLAFETGDYKGSREFCDYIEESLGGEISSVGPCIHGIGHGVSDATDPRMYGKPEALIETGLTLCAQLARTEYEEKICATGVYNALSEWYLAGEHGFEYDEKDPYAICRDQIKPHLREACYEDLKTLILDLGDNKLDQALHYVTEVDDDMRYKKQAMENLALYHVYDIEANDYEYSVRTCQSLQENELRVSCIRGLASGFINSGTPDKEYLRALDFCASDLLTEDDRLQCYDRTLYAAYNRYSSATYASICSMTPETYRAPLVTDYCTEKMILSKTQPAS